MTASADYGNPKADDVTQMLERVSGYLAGTYYPGFSLDDRAMYVAETSGTIIGTIAGHRTLRFSCDGELQWAFVLPDFQRKGFGSSLFASMRQWFVAHKLKKVCVNAPQAMATRAFYLKHGASPMSEHWCVWEDIGRDKKRS